jgi:hypothetical protein
MAKGVKPDKMKPKVSDNKKRGSNHSMNPHRKPGAKLGIYFVFIRGWS